MQRRITGIFQEPFIEQSMPRRLSAIHRITDKCQYKHSLVEKQRTSFFPAKKVTVYGATKFIAPKETISSLVFRLIFQSVRELYLSFPNSHKVHPNESTLQLPACLQELSVPSLWLSILYYSSYSIRLLVIYISSPQR